MTTETAVGSRRLTSTVDEVLAPYETIQMVPAGKVLFREGNDPRGVYYLHSGEVDLRFSSPKSGQTKTLLIAGPGEILGLTSVMSGYGHDSTATARTACITGFVEKARFLRLLEEKPALWVVVLRMISSNISACWECMRSLAAAR